MKRFRYILLLAAALIGCAMNGHAQDIVANGIFYNIISDTQVAVAPAYYDGANHYEGCIILPEKVYCDGVNYDVAAIAPRAFWESKVTQIQIPNSITMIGEAAFEGCNNIHVMLPDAATTRHYENDGIWGDEDQFTLWIDEGLAVIPSMEQENVGQSWTALTLGNSLAYKIYGPDGYLVAVTAADRYFLPIGAQSTDYLVVPTTLMRDEEDLQLIATAEPDAIEEIEEENEPKLTIVGLDGTIYIGGDTHGMWTFIYDVYGNLWYERPAVNNCISLPGPRVYIVRVGKTVRKVFLN